GRPGARDAGGARHPRRASGRPRRTPGPRHDHGWFAAGGGAAVTSKLTGTAPPAPAQIESERRTWWRDEAGESARRNLGLVGVLVALFVIGFITKPELYGDPAWFANNALTIL